MLLHILKYFLLIIVSFVVYTSYICYYPNNVPTSEWRKSNPPFPSESYDNLLWFVQVSDIHISKFIKPQQGPDFEKFCLETLDVISPEVVLVTGDLTDAKSKNRFHSNQYISEWKQYNKILQSTRVTKKYIWVDIRGNHDAFNVKSHNDSSNLYMKYSGDKESHSHKAWKLVKSFGNYSFIHVDATMMPGPKRPFNFIGSLDKKTLDLLYQEGIKASRQSNLTIWYGHYPSSVIVSNSMIGIRSILGQFGTVYLNGHFHTLHGIAETMYAMHSNGFLELELADWKNNRKYRVVAIDHDMLSFSDVSHKDWPVVVITNPKPASFLIPKHEPIGRIRYSTHIRVLAFSPSEINTVSMSIDGIPLSDAYHVKGPLWVCRWNPDLYLKGAHRLEVTVRDKSGSQKLVTSVFSLDTKWSIDFDWTGMFFLLTNICTVAKVLFLLSSVGLLSVITVVRRYGISNLNGWLFPLHLLLSDDLTFYVILLFVLNMVIGPIFVGEMLTDQVGVCFSYGILINGEFSSESLTYIYSFLLIISSYIPITIYLSHCAYLHWRQTCSFKDTFNPRNPSFVYNILLAMHVCSHLYTCIYLMLPYSWVAAVVNPSSSWWNLVAAFLLFRLWRRDPQAMLRNT